MPVSKLLPKAVSKVLIVEENALIALDLEAMLHSSGVEYVQVTSSVEQALSCIEAMRFDAAFLDLWVGGSRTIDVATALDLAGTPLVFATGYEVDDKLLTVFEKAHKIAKPYSEFLIWNVLTELAKPDDSNPQ